MSGMVLRSTCAAAALQEEVAEVHSQASAAAGQLGKLRAEPAGTSQAAGAAAAAGAGILLIKRFL